MKKIAVIFSIILIAQSANAFVDSQYMKTEQFLTNIGYSAENARIVEMNSDNPYRDPNINNDKNIARRLYHYLVPGQNGDLDFYNHSGSYNGWSWKDY